ncbi:DUF7937 domain-containing protein [Mycobacterium conspicuum]|uniref:DUF7937 domain-containing protein n=1 Tax=Mycobacterium conspicuum TaxID=44010 RepID=A0A1X1SWN1_9MYCO|nr:hypothetical protein AWC00_25205 [Mycobacterium conspicuum]BBZ37361.1 hypothetical protein MCNS_04240 [Mycobacterium conspicuum]
MSQGSDDAPTGPITGRVAPPADPPRRRILARDVTAAVLLVVALFLPWNLYFGVGIPGSRAELFAAVGLATLLSLLSLALTKLRAPLNIPYQLLVVAFVVFDVIQTIRSGGGVHVPGGVGPGAWLGIAGSLLAAHPDERSRSAPIIGYASIVLASLSTAFHLCWRVHYALQGGSGLGEQNLAVIATAVVYGAVALAAVLVASRWLPRSTEASRLATSALGASTLLAGILVWLLPVGRDIDAFHGIAQNTSTAGVGYEGYLAWAAGAAIFAPGALMAKRGTAAASAWSAAARKALLLIAVWCLGSVLMRLTDLAVAVALNYPYSRYDTLTLAAFDLATGVLAIWLRVNLANRAVSRRLTTSLCGLLCTLGIARVILGVVLAPRFQEPPTGGGWANPVYGNDLAQQITSTFDVVLCGLALSILAAAVISGRRGPTTRRPRAAHTRTAKPPTPEPATTRIPTRPGGDAPTAVSARPAGSPRIFRGDDSATRQIHLPPAPKPRIYRPPHDPS